MSEPFANEQLSAYLDGELTEAEVAELEAQLERDPALRAELEALQAAAAFVRDHAPVSAPAGFAGRVLARADAEVPAPANDVSGVAWARWLPGIGLAAAALLVVGVAVWPGGPADEAAPAVQPTAAQAPAATPAPAADFAPPPPAGGDVAWSDLNQAYQDYDPKQQAAGGEAQAAQTWRYALTSTDPEVVAGLTTVVASEGGLLEDADGRPVKTGAVGEGWEGSFYVRLDASQVTAFSRALTRLGRVQAIPDPAWYGADLARVRVDVKRAAPGAADAPVAATPDATPAEPTPAKAAPLTTVKPSAKPNTADLRKKTATPTP